MKPRAPRELTQGKMSDGAVAEPVSGTLSTFARPRARGTLPTDPYDHVAGLRAFRAGTVRASGAL